MEQCKYVLGAIFVVVIEHFVAQSFFELDTTGKWVPTWCLPAKDSKIKVSYHAIVVFR